MERLSGRVDDDVALIGELPSYANAALLPELLPFMFGESPAVRRAASAAAHAAFNNASANDLVELEEICRRHSGESWSRGAWPSLRPIDVSRFESLGDDEVAAVGAASFHRSGYVREAAVTRLDALDTKDELRFLLLRLNDWVAPVAERTRVAVERRLTSTYAGAFLDQFALLERLRPRQRRDHADFLGEVRKLLQQPEQRELLLQGLHAEDRRARRFCFHIALETPGDKHLELLRDALTDDDTVIRVDAVTEAQRALDSRGASVLVPIALGDPFPHVRREGLRLADEKGTVDASRQLVEALRDRSRVVREVARFLLRRRGEMSDFASHYREALRVEASPRILSATLAGLGETGTGTDCIAVLPFLRHPRPAVRGAAVGALGSLDANGHLGEFVAALADPARGVSRAARVQLRNGASKVREELHRVFRMGRYDHARREAFSLLSTLGKWVRLPYLLEAAAAKDPDMQRTAIRRLAVWIDLQNRTMVPPTPTELDLIRAAIQAHGASIPTGLNSEIRSAVDFWMR